MSNSLEVEAVFVSYDEPMADALFRRAGERLGMPIKRLHGVHGVGKAYRLTAELVDAEWFFLVDADCYISEDFDPACIDAIGLDRPRVIVWRSRNPVNGLEYGYGGLKLCSVEAMKRIVPMPGADPLANIETEFLNQVACTTNFNQSPFHAWRSGLREVLTLLANDFGLQQSEIEDRVRRWVDVAFDVPFAEWARQGALDAVATWDRDPHGMCVEIGNPTSLSAAFSEWYPGVVQQ